MSDESFEQEMVSVWRQALVEKLHRVTVGGESYAVRLTPKSGLKQLDCFAEGRAIRGLEQNPNTKSRWAAMARSGKRVMQFLEGGKYVGVVVEGEWKGYGKREERCGGF
jgi:hypothetical protein